MKRSNNLLTKSLQRLSSGKRIVSPSDDAGGLAVGMKLQSSLKRSAASRLNTQNGVSFLQMQDGVLKVTGEILDRMAELKSFWNDISKSNDDRETYNHEFNELQKELATLKGQKFNGVSLFAMVEPDNNPLKIITSDDGLGEKIEMSRTGLFENLKSKFGADSILNTGSHGSYRQLVGDFTRDGGLEDSVPGQTSRAYSSGSVIYKNGPTSSESGYFMALSDIGAGTKIEDTGGSTSNWMRLADEGGKGFAESYPLSPSYDHTSMKYNAKGERVAYLKGDIVKVQAHWASPGSHIFLKAQNDIPRGINLESLFAGNHVGPTGYFDYVGSDRSNGATADGKPITEFLRTNANLAQPITYGQTATELRDMLLQNAPNGYNPSHVKAAAGSSIYAPSGDWGVQPWSSLATFKEGALVLDNTDTANPRLLEFNSLVKGNYHGGTFDQGSYVFYDGAWIRADQGNASATDIPRNPANLISISSSSHSHGDAVRTQGAFPSVRVATSVMKGTFDGKQAYGVNDVVYSGVNAGQPVYVSLGQAHHGSWQNLTGTTIAADDTILGSDGFIYRVDSTRTLTSDWTADMASFSKLTAASASPSATDLRLQGAGASTAFSTTAADVVADANGTLAGVAANRYFADNPWQVNNAGANVGDPVQSTDAYVNRTSEYLTLNNSSKWVKTHYSHLGGKTIETSYTRGDNLYYQGKNYVYTSHLDSDDALYTDPANEGFTEFSDLLRLGAIRELPMFVDTRGGGGGSGLPDDIYFRPNQDLKFMDRLPDGSVRTANMARRTDAPLPPGDEIFNSPDDAFYGGLQPGNDGIYGTLDDFYASTADVNVAQQSAHVDADADNNKDLLNGSNNLEHFSVADFVDFIQTLANVRAVNGGTMSRLTYAERILEENEINLGAAASRIMDTDMAYESTKMARQNVLLQAAASMVTQANALNNVVLSLLQ
ncbi:MAG: flagellin [Opitutae bacterium]|nr:flagellin [Opitutae bacterium]